MSSREPVEKTPRRSVSDKRRLALFSRANCRCECGCGEKLKPDWQLEHRIPLWCGGADDESNYEAWNKACHAKKTAREASERGKVNRLIKKADPLTRKPSRMQSRPFSKPTEKKPWPKRPNAWRRPE